MKASPVASAARPPDASDEVRVGMRAWISVGILLLLTVLSSIDRTIIALMVDPIKADLQISDTQFSLLQGFAFVSFYALASLPMAWLADRTSRHWVIYFGVTVWSLCTALCGMAQTFWQLFLTRLGVGAGEATLSPSAYALVGELFPPRRMALAVGVLAAGAAVGAAAAYGVGGAVVQFAESLGGFGGMRPWQMVFVMVGLPGVLLAPLVFIIPGRKRRIPAAAKAVQGLSDSNYLQWLRSNSRYLTFAFLGMGFHTILPYGTAMWTPSYFSREFGMEPIEIGGTLALATGVAGIVGFIGGGWLVDWLHASSVRNAHLKYCLVNCIVSATVGVIAFSMVQSIPLLLVLIAIAHLLFPLTGPMVAHLQMTTPNQYRSRTIALLTIAFNLIGMTLGPTSVALLSDKLYGGPENIGLGIATMYAIFAPISAAMFWFALKPAREAVARRDRELAQEAAM